MVYLHLATTAGFILVLGLSIRLHLRNKTAVTTWAIIMYFAIAAASLDSLVPKDPVTDNKIFLSRIAVSLIVLYPLALYQLSLAFTTRWFKATSAVAYSLKGALILATFAIPSEVARQNIQSPWLKIYLLAIVVQFVGLSIVSAFRSPGVAGGFRVPAFHNAAAPGQR